uniref:Uncharacterized protein n=1 Tax=Setaria viridis TaxID=4556 RepID=A0A4U6U2J7_SETVI|nr:hypothetical protein SEVIR_6G123900v2 [Setaria viridis]
MAGGQMAPVEKPPPNPAERSHQMEQEPKKKKVAPCGSHPCMHKDQLPLKFTDIAAKMPLIGVGGTTVRERGAGPEHSWAAREQCAGTGAEWAAREWCVGAEVRRRGCRSPGVGVGSLVTGERHAEPGRAAGQRRSPARIRMKRCASVGDGRR